MRRPAAPPPVRAAGPLLLLLLGGCATLPGPPSGDAPRAPVAPLELRRALLGRNAGLGAARAEVEARISFAGREASFPGVLALRQLGGFRLDLLDPLDRPLAVVYAERGRLVQYRPAEQYAASLGPFPEGCRDVDPGEWAAAVLGDSPGPPPGEQARVRSFWGTRTLELSRGGELRQSVRIAKAGSDPRPSLISWYCGEDPVMQVRIRSWPPGPDGLLPQRFDISYPRAGLAVSVEVRAVEPGLGPAGDALAPRVGPGTRWTVWNLPR